MANLISYIFTLIVFLIGISVAAVFLTYLHFMTKAYWSEELRPVYGKLSELVPWNFIGLAILAWLYFSCSLSYNENFSAPDAGLKEIFTSPVFLSARFALYYIAWFILYRNLKIKCAFRKETTAAVKNASLYVFIYGLTFSFFALDVFIMFEPHWFNSIFPFYLFSGFFAVSLAAAAIVFIFSSKKFNPDKLSPNPLKALAKMLFGFNIFHAYTLFCMALIAWYGNLPDEAGFFAKRTDGIYYGILIFFLIVEFALPFVLLLSKKGKANRNVVLTASFFLISGFLAELFWMFAL